MARGENRVYVHEPRKTLARGENCEGSLAQSSDYKYMHRQYVIQETNAQTSYRRHKCTDVIQETHRHTDVIQEALGDTDETQEDTYKTTLCVSVCFLYDVCAFVSCMTYCLCMYL